MGADKTKGKRRLAKGGGAEGRGRSISSEEAKSFADAVTRRVCAAAASSSSSSVWASCAGHLHVHARSPAHSPARLLVCMPARVCACVWMWVFPHSQTEPCGARPGPFKRHVSEFPRRG